MTITVTDRGEHQTAAGGTITLSKVSSAFSPAAGTVLTVEVTLNGQHSGGGSSDLTVGITDNIGDTGGGAWTQQATCTRGAVTGTQYYERVETWTRVVGTSPGTSKTVTVTATGNAGAQTTTTDGWLWFQLKEWAGVDTSSPVESAVSPSAATAVSSFNITLPSAPSSTAAITSVIHCDDNSTLATKPTSWTDAQSETPAWGASSQSAHIIGSGSTTSTWTGLANAAGKRWLACGIALKAAPTAQTTTAQIATLALSGVPGVSTIGLTTVAQIATLTLTGVAGVSTGGPTTKVAQVATLTLTGVSGISVDARWPTSIAADSRTILDQYGQPWYAIGDDIASAPAQLTDTEQDQVLADRARKGFRVVWINAPEYKFADNAPSDILGNAPFTGTAYQSSLGSAYWARVDRFVLKAKDLGITCLILTNYLGWNGGDEGWSTELAAASNAQVTAFGTAIGTRYPPSTYPNIIWGAGGDRVPDATLYDRIDHIMLAIRAAGATQLITCHGHRGDTGDSLFGSYPWLDINSCYTTGQNVADIETAYADTPTRPTFYFEGQYEWETYLAAWSTVTGRRQLYGPLFEGHFATLMGNDPLWYAGSTTATGYTKPSAYDTWPEALDSPLSLDAQRCARFLASYEPAEWKAMVPGTGSTLVTTGEGTTTAKAAIKWDATGGRAVVYFPSSRSITLDLSVFTPSQLTLRWFDPTAGTYTTIGTYANTSGRTVTYPTSNSNSEGADDWVLVVGPANPAQTTHAQIGTLTLSGVPGVSAVAQTTVAQVATLTLAGVAGVSVPGAATKVAQVATLTLTGVAGVSVAGAVTTTAQPATLTLAAVQGVSTGGPTTTTAQIATLTLTGVPGVSTTGMRTVAQVATIDLTGVPGASTGGATATVAQVAQLTLTGVSGASVTGPATTVAQPATLTLTGVAGTSTIGTPGEATTVAQPATLTLSGVAGVSAGGSRTHYPAHSSVHWNSPTVTARWNAPSVQVAWEN